jgi:hypothetical protein
LGVSVAAFEHQRLGHFCHILLVKYPIPTVDISVSTGYMVRKVLIHLSQNWVRGKIGGHVYFFKRKNKGFL